MLQINEQACFINVFLWDFCINVMKNLDVLGTEVMGLTKYT